MTATNSEEVERLISGHLAFRKNYYATEEPVFKSLLRDEATPEHLVVTCTDSCMDPAILLSCAPNEILVHRNLGNVIPPYENQLSDCCTGSALEMAVSELGVSSIILLGHRDCATINRLLRKDTLAKDESLIDGWLELMSCAKEQTQAQADLSDGDKVEVCAKLSLLLSLKNLYSYPFIKEAVAKQRLSCHAWFFEIDSGYLLTFNEDDGEFELVREPVAKV